MINKNDHKKKPSLNQPDEFTILEEGIDFQTHKEYVEYSDSFESSSLTEEETIHLGNILYNNKVAVEGKKKTLILLAHLGTITALRQIEKYYNQADKELKPWSALALQECKMFLEGALTDHMTGFVSSGLGGLKNRMRYYFLVLPLEDQLFTVTQKNVIKDEMCLVAKDLRSLVESFDLSDSYVGFTTLMPLDIAIATFVETGIRKCNELGEFVFEFYYATNQDIPNKSGIEEIIRIIRSD